MPISWRDSRDEFERILRRHALDPDAVDDVETAWVAFGEFLGTAVAGITAAAEDGDGFISEWGAYPWNDGLPSLVFGRQLAVTDCAGSDAADPQLWRVDLELLFADRPELAAVDGLACQNTGFDFDEIGPERAARLVAVRDFMHGFPELATLWAAKPLRSQLTLERVD